MKNLLKKIFLPLIITLFFGLTLTAPAFADSAFDGRDGAECPDFLGLTSWDCGVNISDQESLKNGIWTIMSNVAADITVIASYLVLGYVMYGGYLYLFASGDVGKAAAGKKTLVHAFIGLAIVLSARLIMGTIRIVLVQNGDFTSAGQADPTLLVTNLINWFIAFSGIVAAIFLVYGGITYITSSGDSSKVTKAKDVIKYSLIGLIIVAIASILTAFATNAINNANRNAETSILNQTTISKEVHEININ